jgi:septum formation protein
MHLWPTLFRLSGTTHQVVTGVTLIKNTSGRLETRSFFEVTQVCMSELDDQTKNAYINTNEPLDKAGAYGNSSPLDVAKVYHSKTLAIYIEGIQGLGSSIIKSITGDYFNVMGFPVYKFATELLEFL